ncbi:SCO family protein [Ramlibacter sp.]|uniref:SCO family protein n=1 Tax=Ramlibacter sp. TaxID=1917967 RepID=UPI002D38BF17|nr:SCO family protein [Ramlibacter sp.]HYD77679.1 SCO family protein [Ramlibacter sp.]
MPDAARLIALLARPCFAAVLAAFAALAAAQEVPKLDAREAQLASQAVVGQLAPDAVLLDRKGKPVALSSYRGKPLMVSFIYTGCFEICPATTRSLLEAVEALGTRFGDHRFNVVSIGFNQPADSPEAMRAFAAQNRIDRDNWNFLSAPAAVLPQLTSGFGFRYAMTPAGFDHVLQVTLLDAEGRIVRQVYGDRPAVDTLGEALTALVAGQPVPQQGLLEELWDQIRIVCTVYDPDTGTYRVDYSLIWEIAGGLTFILAMALYMLNEWRQRRRQRRKESPHAPQRLHA